MNAQQYYEYMSKNAAHESNVPFIPHPSLMNVICYYPSYVADSRRSVFQPLTHPHETMRYMSPVVKCRDWRSIPISLWSPKDVCDWLFDFASFHSIKIPETVPLFAFLKVDGLKLIHMSRDEFLDRFSTDARSDDRDNREFVARFFYDSLVSLKSLEEAKRRENLQRSRDISAYCGSSLVETGSERPFSGESASVSSSRVYSPTRFSPIREPVKLKRLKRSGASSSEESDEINVENCSATEEVTLVPESDPVPCLRRPGRPRGSGKKRPLKPKNPSLPEFLKSLLSDPRYCPRIIKWENYADKKFRFVDATEVSKLWGSIRSNDSMTYVNFSRAMRYYYQKDVLVSVKNNKLVYQFGEKGPNVSTSDPNFERGNSLSR